MILHLYFARKFLWMFLGISFVFLALLTLIDFVEQVRRFDSAVVSFWQVVELTLLNAPAAIYNILPLVMILATVAMFLGLARSSELVASRAAGRSGLRSLMAPVVVALLLGGIAVAMFNPIVAATSKRYHTLFENYRSGGTNVLSISAEGLWLRQGGPEGQSVIRAVSSNPDATVLYDVTIIAFSPNGDPLRRIEAQSARLTEGAWDLRNVKSWPLTAGLNPESSAQRQETLSIPSSLTLEGIRDSFGTPQDVSIWDLPTYIRQLELAGFSARRYTVWLQMELARPLFLTAMVLIAAAFTMRHARGGGTGVAVLTAILLGFSLYYIRNFAQILGENGQVPVLLAAWAPPVASVMLALGILLHKEDG